jgi:MarR family transcriptional regulator, organic hydroperoxide resistance regulator
MTESEKFIRNRDFSNEVHRLLHQIGKTDDGYEQACVAFFGVTSTQGGTLLTLPPKGNLKMNELSAAVGVDSSTMTRMVDQLVGKGLVFRKVDEKDRRLVCIGLTAAGLKLHQQLDLALRDFYSDSLNEIHAEERAVILQSLEKLSAAMARGVESCCQKYCTLQDAKSNREKK